MRELITPPHSTPGPWILSDDGLTIVSPNVGWTDADGKLHPPPRIIADFECEPFSTIPAADYMQLTADAEIMAGAPGLLYAARLALLAIGELEASPKAAHDYLQGGVADVLRAAIAKAEGRAI